MGGIPPEQQLDGLLAFARAVGGQVDLRQRETRVLEGWVLIQERLKEPGRLVALAA